MSLLHAEARLLWGKELEQLTRSWNAMLSILVVPVALMVLGPISALLAATTRNFYITVAPPKEAARLPGFATTIHSVEDYFLYILLPILFVLAALLTPVLTATQSLIGERERRSLELLMALPVVVDDIVTAKLAANVAIAVATILPMFFVDAIVLRAVGRVDWTYIGWASVLVLGSVTASVGASILLALTARDLRTAMSSGALLLAVPLGLTGLCLTLVPGVARFLVIGILLFALGVGAAYGGLRWLTYERYVT